ncbi:hypothetical protein ABEX47_04295 [Paenibacillus ehimensis]
MEGKGAYPAAGPMEDEADRKAASGSTGTARTTCYLGADRRGLT